MKKLSDAVDRFCYNHPRFGIPNLMKIIVVGNLIVWLLARFSNLGAVAFLGFDLTSVLHGEIWRLVTFVFVPDMGDLLGNGGMFTMALSLYFYYWIGNLLEREWGTPKFTLYYLSGMVLTMIVSSLSGSPVYGTYYVNMSMFLAMAVLYPNMQLLLFFIIPVKVKWLAWMDAALFAVDILRSVFAGYLLGALLPVIALFNFLVFFWPAMWEQVQYRRGVTRHRNVPQTVQFKNAAKQQAKKAKEQGYRHKCSVCGRTDTDHPELQFRYCSRCAGYHCFCEEHIFSHEHFTE